MQTESIALKHLKFNLQIRAMLYQYVKDDKEKSYYEVLQNEQEIVKRFKVWLNGKGYYITRSDGMIYWNFKKAVEFYNDVMPAMKGIKQKYNLTNDDIAKGYGYKSGNRLLASVSRAKVFAEIVRAANVLDYAIERNLLKSETAKEKK